MNRLLTCCCKRTSLVCVTDEAVSSQDAAPPSPLPWSDSILKGHQHPPKEDNYPKGPLCIRVRRRRPRSPRLLFEQLPLGPKKKAHKEPPYLGEVYGALEFPRENPSQGIGVDLPRGAIAVKQLVPKA